MLAHKDVALAEQDLRVSALEQTGTDGTLVWKISDISRKRQEAIAGKVTSLYSPAFYTSKHGKVNKGRQGLSIAPLTHWSSSILPPPPTCFLSKFDKVNRGTKVSPPPPGQHFISANMVRLTKFIGLYPLPTLQRTWEGQLWHSPCLPHQRISEINKGHQSLPMPPPPRRSTSSNMVLKVNKGHLSLRHSFLHQRKQKDEKRSPVLYHPTFQTSKLCKVNKDRQTFTPP